ncbi:MAG: hypothetical protein GY869_28055, partial [Planctomycetes bacterium]|nr:hypothetical protein [Planctomycetota bacterium]
GVILACVLEFLALSTWMFMREKFNKLYLLVGPGVIGFFLLMDVLVETNREQLDEATRVIVQAAQDEEAEIIIDLLSSNMLVNNKLSKDMVAVVIRGYLGKPMITKNRVNELLVQEVSEQGGQVEVALFTTFDPKGNYSMVPPLMTSRWRLNFVKDSDGQYRVSDINNLRMGGSQGIDVLSSIRRFK